jgi:hypothetical protein
MRPLTLESAKPDLVGSRLFCPRARAFYPVITVTKVEPWLAHMVFISFVPDNMPDGEFLLELADHPNTRLLVDSGGSPWHILEPGEEPPN